MGTSVLLAMSHLPEPDTGGVYRRRRRAVRQHPVGAASGRRQARGTNRSQMREPLLRARV